MSKDLLDLLEELFELQTDVEFRAAKELLNNNELEITHDKEVDAARKTVFETVLDRFSNDEVIDKYLSKEARAFYESDLENTRKKADYSDEQLIYGLLAMIYTDGTSAYMENYLDESLPTLRDLAEQVGYQSLIGKLKKIKDKSTLEEKTNAFKNALPEILDTIQKKMLISAKDRTGKARMSIPAKSRIDHVVDLSIEVSKMLEDAYVNVHLFRSKLMNLLSLESKLYHMVELGKEDTPLKSGSAPTHSEEKEKERRDYLAKIETDKSKGSRNASKAGNGSATGSTPNEDYTWTPGEGSTTRSGNGSGTGTNNSGSSSNSGNTINYGNIGDDDEFSPEDLGDDGVFDFDSQDGAHIDNDDEMEPKKKIWVKVAIGLSTVAALVGIGTGIFYLGKTAGKAEKPESSKDSDPNETSSLNPEDKTPNGTPSIEEYIEEAQSKVHQNWQGQGSTITDSQVGEVIKALNNFESQYTPEQAYYILVDMINKAVEPGINNVLAGENNAVMPLDFSSLIVGDPAGLEAVKRMEANLNGCLTDPENIETYAKSALTDIARVIARGETVDGMSISDDKTDPGLRIVWASLGLAINPFTGVVDEPIMVEIDGQVYSQLDIEDGSQLYGVISDAQKELGIDAKALTLTENNGN